MARIDCDFVYTTLIVLGWRKKRFMAVGIFACAIIPFIMELILLTPRHGEKVVRSVRFSFTLYLNLYCNAASIALHASVWVSRSVIRVAEIRIISRSSKSYVINACASQTLFWLCTILSMERTSLMRGADVRVTCISRKVPLTSVFIFGMMSCRVDIWSPKMILDVPKCVAVKRQSSDQCGLVARRCKGHVSFGEKDRVLCGIYVFLSVSFLESMRFT